ncbi:hypothetical protein ANN_09178 [Periplaneta americana]|uniref:Uncharacterized protein n=1 Tax=Periplaneta americana TaxID=6978 RepID=A0ABQ8TL03_PERAM|nr:hypothetical protein ANN_09178 [Periplaneta americana]
MGSLCEGGNEPPGSLKASKILRKRLRFHPYRLQLLQALKPEDKMLGKKFCISMQTLLENDDEFICSVVFSDEATFHLSGGVRAVESMQIDRQGDKREETHGEEKIKRTETNMRQRAAYCYRQM